MNVNPRFYKIKLALVILVLFSSLGVDITAKASQKKREVPANILQVLNDDACKVRHLHVVDIVTPSNEDILKYPWRKKKDNIGPYLAKALANREHVFIACEYNKKGVITSQFLLLDLDSIRILWHYKGSEYSPEKGGYKTHQVRFLKSPEMGEDELSNIEVLQTTLPAKEEVPYMPGPPLTLLFSYQEPDGYVQISSL